MQNITNLSLSNYVPLIGITQEGLDAIKHIVSIAPQEAQWFHCLTPHPLKSGHILLELSTKLFIPKQNTSIAEVDSTSTMMIDFYHELKNTYELSEVNNILNSMTCWCHSHHTMAPTPSGQDQNQFANFVQSAKDQNQSNWQVMLIFNKHHKFYSKVYDPNTGMVFEGVQIKVLNNYDFSYIDKAAKTKFLKPKVKNIFGKNSSFSKPNKISSKAYLEDRLFHSLKSLEEDILDPSQELHPRDYLQDSDCMELAENLVDDIYHSFYPDLGHQHLLSVLPKNKTSNQVYQDIQLSLQEDELVWLSFLCKKKGKNIKNIFTPNQIQSYLSRYPNKPKEIICHYLNNSHDTLIDFKEKLLKVMAVSKCEFSTQVKELF